MRPAHCLFTTSQTALISTPSLILLLKNFGPSSIQVSGLVGRMLHHSPSGPQQIGSDRKGHGNHQGEAGSRATGLPSCDLLECLRVCLVLVLNHVGEHLGFQNGFCGGVGWTGLGREHCSGSLLTGWRAGPQGVVSPEVHQVFYCTGPVGKEGETFPETTSLWKGLTCSNQRRKQKPLYSLSGVSLTQNRLVFF